MLPEPSEESTSVNLSSNTLFHFTNNMDNLLNILKNDFVSHLSIERFDENGNIAILYAAAMVSFCDLPLSTVKQHLRYYGSYGIGLSKRWGISKGISPVLYVHERSKLYAIQHHIKDIEAIRLASSTEVHDETVRHAKQDELRNNLLNVNCYIKPYEGYAWRNGKFDSKIKRFYDEKEWRYVPTPPMTYGLFGFPPEDENSEYKLKEFEKNKKKWNEVTAEMAGTISFTPNDIHYIVVEREAEILEMIQKVEETKSKFDYDSVRTLITRIISAERIREDF